MHIEAVRFIRAAAHGSSHPSLIEASDGQSYWLKFQGNPQGSETLINEWTAVRLAALVGLPVPETRLISVSADFIRRNPGTYFYRAAAGHGLQQPFPGIALGIAHVAGSESGTPETQKASTAFFAGGLVFDVWTCQEDRRQAIFRSRRSSGPGVAFIDFGRAFAPSHLDHALEFTDGGRAPYARHFNYSRLRSMAVFEPWLDRIDRLPDAAIDSAVTDVPPEWFDLKSAWDCYERDYGDGRSPMTPAGLRLRARSLKDRRQALRVALEAEIAYSRDYLCCWEDHLSEAAMGLSEERRARETEDVF